MQKNKVSAACFAATTGYGYDDVGRDNLERVYADVFHTEAALVRPQITCGTHALTVALSANLLPGDELLSPVGLPYDTLQEVIGIRPSPCSLAEYGVSYRQADLNEDGSFNYEAIRNAITEKTKMITIQRSKGYDSRPTLSVERIGELIKFIKSIKPSVICMVDNCYGEFVETIEPSDVGADLIVGTHAHTLQGIDFYNDKAIVYNIGDFIFNHETKDTGIFQLKIDNEGNFKYYFLPCQQKDKYTFLLNGNEQIRVLNKMRKLSPNITITKYGEIIQNNTN